MAALAPGGLSARRPAAVSAGHWQPGRVLVPWRRRGAAPGRAGTRGVRSSRVQLAKTEVLPLDDRGMAAPDVQARSDLPEIVDDRAAGEAAVITGQLPIDHGHAWVGDAAIAEAILDRLMQQNRRLPLAAQSRRWRAYRSLRIRSWAHCAACCRKLWPRGHVQATAGVRWTARSFRRIARTFKRSRTDPLWKRPAPPPRGAKALERSGRAAAAPPSGDDDGFGPLWHEIERNVGGDAASLHV